MRPARKEHTHLGGAVETVPLRECHLLGITHGRALYLRTGLGLLSGATEQASPPKSPGRSCHAPTVSHSRKPAEVTRYTENEPVSPR